MRELTEEFKEKIRKKAEEVLTGCSKIVIDDYIKLYELAWIDGEVEV